MSTRKVSNSILVETGGLRLSRAERRKLRRQAMLRYQKHRQKNLLAQPGVHDMILVLDHLKAGFNVAKIFRSAEFMGVHEVHLIGIEPFDPAPAKGGFKKVPARFHADFDTCHADLSARGYQFFTLDPGSDCQQLNEIQLPRRSAFILGHEELGITFERARFPSIRCLSIPGFGTTESLNVGVAAAIVMYEYINQHGLDKSPSIES